MSSVLQEIEERINNIQTAPRRENTGIVTEIGDGVAKIEGLDDLMMNEMIDLGKGVTGIALNLEETSVGAVLMGDYTQIAEGQEARGTGRKDEEGGRGPAQGLRRPRQSAGRQVGAIRRAERKVHPRHESPSFRRGTLEAGKEPERPQDARRKARRRLSCRDESRVVRERHAGGLGYR